MSEFRAFEPEYNSGQFLNSTTVAATATAVSGSLPGSTTIPNAQRQIQIANQSTAWAYVNAGPVGSVVAATVANSYPVAPGAVVVISVPGSAAAVSVILSTGTGNVIFTRGEGL